MDKKKLNNLPTNTKKSNYNKNYNKKRNGNYNNSKNKSNINKNKIDVKENIISNNETKKKLDDKVKVTKNSKNKYINKKSNTHEKTIENNYSKTIVNLDVNKEKLDDKVKLTKNSKNKRKKRVILVSLLFIILISLSILFIYYLDKENKEKIRLETLRKEQELVNIISSHYNEFVITNKEVNIYNDNEEIIGKLYNAEISLKEINIDKDTKYFEIKDFDNYYIKYKDVSVIEGLSYVNQRYKNYIIFNQSIVTNANTTFYDEFDNKVYEFYTSFDLPIIIKDTDKYGVEFNNRLLYVKKDDIKEIRNNSNTDINNSSGVAVLNYHSFYDETSYEERRECPTSICHSKAQFRQHLDYLKENNIFTLTAKEIEMYVDGKIQLPKSVYITIDDGVKTKHAVDLLTEYKMNGTIFLVTSWAYEPNYYITEYVELHSHTHNLHNPGVCPGGQGGAIKCLNRETLLADLRQSREDLNGSTVFCYPFYEYNNYSISVLKEAGFTMAFGGEYGDMLVKVGMDKFRLPRFVITTNTTMYSLDNYFKRIKN